VLYVLCELFVYYFYLELSLLDDEESFLLLAGVLDLLLGGERPPPPRLAGDLLRPFPERLRFLIGDRRRGEGERRRRGLGERPRRRGEGDLRRLGDGERRRLGEGRRAGARGINTGAAVISCPSICPPSMCFIAFWAFSGVWYSIYANPLLIQGRDLSFPKSMSLIFPNVPKISSKCSLRTFLVNRPM